MVDILGGGATLGGVIIVVIDLAVVAFLGEPKGSQISIRLRIMLTVRCAPSEIVVDGAFKGLAVGGVQRLDVVDFGVIRTGFYTRDAVHTVAHTAFALDVREVHGQCGALGDNLVVFEVSDNARAVHRHGVGKRGEAEG